MRLHRRRGCIASLHAAHPGQPLRQRKGQWSVCCLSVGTLIAPRSLRPPPPGPSISLKGDDGGMVDRSATTPDGLIPQFDPQPVHSNPCRNGKIICAYSPEVKKPFPWAMPSSGAVVAMCMSTDDRLLILTHQAQLFSVPLASAVAGASMYASIKPLGLKAHHGTTHAMAFDPRSNVLAILGEGSKSKTLPGLSLTLWSAQGSN